MHMFGKSSLKMIVGERRCQVTIMPSMNASNCFDSVPRERAKVPTMRQSVIKVVILMLLEWWDKSGVDEVYISILLSQQESRDWLILQKKINWRQTTMFNSFTLWYMVIWFILRLYTPYCKETWLSRGKVDPQMKLSQSCSALCQVMHYVCSAQLYFELILVRFFR